MFGLRSLIVAIIVVPSFGFGAELSSLKYQLSVDGQSGYLNSFEPDKRGTTSEVEHRLTSRGGFGDSFSFDASYSRLKRDYGQIELLQRNGVREKLADSFDRVEHVVGATVTKIGSRDQLSLSTLNHASESPYARRSLGLDFVRRGPYDVYRYGASGSYSRTNQPEAVYVDREFVTRERPDVLDVVSIGIWGERVLSERSKARGEISIGRRVQDRPDHLKFVAKFAQAISNRISTRIGAGVIEEASTVLKDERGRFRNRFVDTEVSWLHSYRFTSHASYGLLIEEEYEKSDGSSDQTGHDVFSAGANYKFNGFIVDGAVMIRKTNSSVEERGIRGGIEWEI